MFFAWGWRNPHFCLLRVHRFTIRAGQKYEDRSCYLGMPDGVIRSKENECLDTVLRSASSAAAS